MGRGAERFWMNVESIHLLIQVTEAHKTTGAAARVSPAFRLDLTNSVKLSLERGCPLNIATLQVVVTQWLCWYCTMCHSFHLCKTSGAAAMQRASQSWGQALPLVLPDSSSGELHPDLPVSFSETSLVFILIVNIRKLFGPSPLALDKNLVFLLCKEWLLFTMWNISCTGKVEMAPASLFLCVGRCLGISLPYPSIFYYVML